MLAGQLSVPPAPSCSRSIPSGPRMCWCAERPAPEVWEEPGGGRLTAAEPQTLFARCVHVSCCVQNGVTPEVRGRHQSEDAALQRLFDDAARPDTPGEFSNAFACRLTLEVGCCLRPVHSGKSAASRFGHAGQPFPSCILFVGVPQQAGSATDHTVPDGFHCLSSLARQFLSVLPQPFREPATTPSGLSYERSALLNHIKSVSVPVLPCPWTKSPRAERSARAVVGLLLRCLAGNA